MKHIWSRILSGIMVAAFLTGCSQQGGSSKSSVDNESGSQNAKLLVSTSFYPMYDFVSKIGGDKVDITNMVPSGTEPHDWEPAAADIVALEKASVFVYNGAGLEHWVDDVLQSLSNKDLIVAEASKNVGLLEGEDHHDDEEDHEEETEEISYDPHVWLNPLNAKKEMENIKTALIQADPKNTDYYETNYKKYADELEKLDEEFRAALSSLPRKEIVVAHEAFGYLCDAYGLEQVGIEGLAPDSEPDPARMAEIIDFVKEHDVKVIFFEELVSSKVAETIAKATGAQTDVLNPYEGLTDKQKENNDDYFAIMLQNLEALKMALK